MKWGPLVFVCLVFAGCGWLNEHFCDDENLLTISQPSTVESFEVRDSKGAVLWRIESAEGREIREIHLGDIPQGFIQTLPSSGHPRRFNEAEELTTFTVARSHTLRHKGVANGPASFCGGFYESTPRR